MFWSVGPGIASATVLGVGDALEKQKSLTDGDPQPAAGVKSVWPSSRTLITHSQVNSQLGSVLNVRFPAAYEALMRPVVGARHRGRPRLRRVHRARQLLDQVDQGGRAPAVRDAGHRRRLHLRARQIGRETARKHAAGNAFFVLFFCYPTICNTLFASFICTDLFDGHSVLTSRTARRGPDHVTAAASLLLVVPVACGVP